MPVPAPSLCSSPRGTGLPGLKLPAWIPGLGWARGEAQLRAAVRCNSRWTTAELQHSLSSSSTGLAMEETQIQRRESKEGTGCQAESEHKSSSVQKLDSQPVEEVLEANSTPGDPRPPHIHHSWMGIGCLDGSTASMAAPATGHGSI